MPNSWNRGQKIEDETKAKANVTSRGQHFGLTDTLLKISVFVGLQARASDTALRPGENELQTIERGRGRNDHFNSIFVL